MRIDLEMLDMNSLYLIGASGHARVVYDALQRGGFHGSIEVRDDNPALSGSSFHDLRIHVPALPDGVLTGWFAHVAIGDNRVRAGLIEKVCSIGARLLNILHPDATVALTARYEDGCFLAAQSVLAPDARLGMGCIINHGAVVDHDCEIDNFTHIAPHATLGGGVRVGCECLIGAGAVVLPGRRIGNGVVIGAGAVVVKDVPDGARWVGVPATALR